MAKKSKIPGKQYPQFENEFDIRNSITAEINEKYHLVGIKKQAQLEDFTMSLFLNGHRGMGYDRFVRLLAVMGYKIIDPSGKVVIGNPENRKLELDHNNFETNKEEDENANQE